MTEWDAPNQQVVRPDQSAPWQEGEGGSGPEGSTDPQAATGLDAMSKAELLEYARSVGAKPANNDMSKDELRASIAEAES